MKPTNLTLEDIVDAASAISTADLCEDLQVDDAIARVTAAVNVVEAKDVDDLLRLTTRVVALASGVPADGAFHKLADVDRAHRCRNVFAAIVALAADLGDVDPRDLLARLAPARGARPGGRGRALTDDEVLVLRVYTSHLMRTATRVEPAITYLLTEAGANPSEATTVTPKRLTPEMSPNKAKLPGVNGIVPKRKVDIPLWGRVPLRFALTLHMTRHAGAKTTPIAYRGTKQAGGHAASASASGNLNRLYREVGIDHRSVTPMSVVRWRVATTKRVHGLKAAAKIRGLDAPKDALRARLQEFSRAA
ncbi:hypothetical protein Q6348_08360 [Isoptericola sp. b441]|uniref:Tyr recombinase domain-containing protein n=1 Tax=Actinotalea lenta TaxID=3064654 RepID=A0ABT9D8J6_9CELL|nr:hypothetical protein [Isoptericola sp. b441]MDO8107206.1 hypothetical protein [Isoptericola sp. b441]